MKCFALEGNTQLLDGGAMFGNAPKAMWEKWSAPDAHNRIALACRCLLVQDAGKNILFVAGIGAFFNPKMKARFGVVEQRHVLLDSLAAIHLTPDDIHAVVLSHLHFDHAGGLLSAYEQDKQSALLFKNATYYVGAEHWQRALNPHPRDRASFVPDLNALLLASGRLKFVTDANETPLGAKIRFSFSNGHTPGLMLSTVQTDTGFLTFASDLVPGAPWVHVPISMGYDRYPELVIDEKAHFLEKIYAQQGSLFFTHDIQCASGLLLKSTDGKYSVQPNWHIF